jgi:hypothetical protein
VAREGQELAESTHSAIKIGLDDPNAYFRPTSAIQAKLLNGNNAAQRTFKSIDIAFTFWGLC